MTGNGRDDRTPRRRADDTPSIRVLNNHLTLCSACAFRFDPRLFVSCPFCAIRNFRRATDPRPPGAA